MPKPGNEKLKPCPFCGSEKLDYNKDLAGVIDDYVECRNCEAYLPEALDDRTMVEHWNKRVSDNDEEYF